MVLPNTYCDTPVMPVKPRKISKGKLPPCLCDSEQNAIPPDSTESAPQKSSPTSYRKHAEAPTTVFTYLGIRISTPSLEIDKPDQRQTERKILRSAISRILKSQHSFPFLPENPRRHNPQTTQSCLTVTTQSCLTVFHPLSLRLAPGPMPRLAPGYHSHPFTQVLLHSNAFAFSHSRT